MEKSREILRNFSEISERALVRPEMNLGLSGPNHKITLSKPSSPAKSRQYRVAIKENSESRLSANKNLYYNNMYTSTWERSYSLMRSSIT